MTKSPADRRHRPDAGGRGQAADLAAVLEDRSRTDEADARHDLGRNPGRVGADAGESVAADDREQGRPKRHQAVSSEPGRLTVQLALEADQSPEHQAHDKSQREVELGFE
jgi:hypothetical protein